MPQIAKTVKEINPLFIVATIFIGVLYLTEASRGIPAERQNLYLGGMAVMILLAFLTKERRLLELDEAIKIAYKNARRMKAENITKYEGKLVPIEDAKLWEMQERPKAILCGIGIEGDEPKVIVYYLDPYSGYIKHREVVQWWKASHEPDLKIVFTSYLEDLVKEGKLSVLKDLRGE